MEYKYTVGYRTISPHGEFYDSFIQQQRLDEAGRFSPDVFQSSSIKKILALQLQADVLSPEEMQRKQMQIASYIRDSLRSYWDDIHDYPEIQNGIAHLWHEALSEPVIREQLHFDQSYLHTNTYPQNRRTLEEGEYGPSHLLLPEVVDDATLLDIVVHHGQIFNEKQRKFNDRLPHLKQDFLTGMQRLADERIISTFDRAQAQELLDNLHVDYADEIPAQQILSQGVVERTSSVIETSHRELSSERLQKVKYVEKASVRLENPDGTVGEFHLKAVASSTTSGAYRPDTATILLSAQDIPEKENRALFEAFAKAIAGKRAKQIVEVHGREYPPTRRIIHDIVGISAHSRKEEKTFFSVLNEATCKLLTHRLLQTTPDYNQPWHTTNNDVAFLSRLLDPLRATHQGDIEQVLFDAYLTNRSASTRNTAWTLLNKLLNSYYGRGFLGRLEGYFYGKPLYLLNPNVTEDELKNLPKPPIMRRFTIVRD